MKKLLFIALAAMGLLLIIDRIRTTATILDRHTTGRTDTAITATTVIITTIGTKLT